MPEDFTISGNAVVIGYAVKGHSRDYLKYNANKTIIVPEGIEEIADAAFQGEGAKCVILPTSIKAIGRSVFQHADIKHIIILSKNYSCRSSILANNDCTRYVTSISEGEYKTIFVPTELSVPRRGRAKSSIRFTKKDGLKVDVEAYMAVDKMSLPDKFMRAFYATRYFGATAHEDIRKCMKAGMEYAFEHDEIDLDNFIALYEMGDITKTNITYLKRLAQAYEKDDIYDYLCSIKPKG